MCGICGVLNPPDLSGVARMCADMAHRGPDDDGLYHDDLVALGIRRLAIIDVATGRQPITNEDGSLVIVYNGEIYNYQELRADLEKRGHRFKTQSDTESILHLYEEYGTDCVCHLCGMFALALWDRSRQRLFLARDRLGIKPLYYARAGQQLVFASEVKALLASQLVPARLNAQAIPLYLAFYSVPAPYTILENIQALMPGHRLVAENGRIEIQQYWDVEFEYDGSNEISALPFPEICIRLRAMLEETVCRHLMSEVPLGAFLSGGIDSSTVVGLLASKLAQPVKTFSVGFGQEGHQLNELSFARQIARRFGADHTEVIVAGNDVRNEIDRLIWATDQPAGDGVNSYFVSKAARTRVTVALSGLGGDELFAGYPQFSKLALQSRLQAYGRRWPDFIRLVLDKGVQRVSPDWRSRSPFRWVAALAGTAGNFVQQFAPFRSLYRPDELSACLATEFAAQVRDAENVQSYLARYVRAEESDVVRQVGRIELKHYMANTLLRDSDAMSMAHSLEMRVPFVDHKLVEFVNAIPSCYKLGGRTPKPLLVAAVSDILPREVLERRKMGFEIPMAAWLRNELRPIAEDALSPDAVKRRGILCPDFVQNLYQRFQEHGDVPYIKIWSLVVLELWMRRFIDMVVV